MRRALYYMLGITLVFMGWRHFHRQQLTAMDAGDPLPDPAGDAATLTVERPDTAVSSYRCDGRVYCSQMHSCDEATWFINHCPGMKMDGDHDGIPCETQHCGR